MVVITRACALRRSPAAHDPQSGAAEASSRVLVPESINSCPSIPSIAAAGRDEAAEHHVPLRDRPQSHCHRCDELALATSWPTGPSLGFGGPSYPWHFIAGGEGLSAAERARRDRDARRPGLAAPRVARASRSCGWRPPGRRPRPDALVDHQPPLGLGVDLPPQVRKRLHDGKDERFRIEGLSPLEDEV